MAEMTEKVYCFDRPQDNTAAFISAMKDSNSPAEMMALMNGGGGQWNNPFIYLVWMMFANRFFGNGEGANVANLSNQMADNQNSNLLMDAIKGNGCAISQLASNLNCDFNALNSSINCVSNGITALAGQVGTSREAVINSVLLGNKDLTSALQSCCCQTQQSILKMGYENQISTMNQTTQLQERLTGIANGLQQGFSSTAYETQRQTCDILNNNNANTQRIVDVLNNHWNSELQLKYQDAKAELSQSQQTNALTAQLTAIAQAIAKIPTT